MRRPPFQIYKARGKIFARQWLTDHRPFSEWKRLLFHIDQGMSRVSVRDLGQMRNTLLVIHNIAAPTEVPNDVAEWIGRVKDNLDEVFSALAEGEIDKKR
jgi:hypothetical protein